MGGQWPTFEVLQGQKGKQMAASPWWRRGFAVSGESQSSMGFVARWEAQLYQLLAKWPWLDWFCLRHVQLGVSGCTV